MVILTALSSPVKSLIRPVTGYPGAPDILERSATVIVAIFASVISSKKGFPMMFFSPEFNTGSGIFTTSVGAAFTLLNGKNTVVIKNKAKIILTSLYICFVSSLVVGRILYSWKFGDYV